MLTQTIALCLDAYRELNARKLFWITMVLNLMAVFLFAAMGINDRGVSFLHWTFDNPVFTSKLVTPELFYKIQFTSWGIPIWLSWVATILALVSTAGLIPDLISGGVIETVLSKPIGRVRLLLTKYVFGLLFVVLQVFVFSLGCFLVLLIRGRVAVPELFLAVPIVSAFFSYLFAVCVLLGLVTRSTVAALLLTILFWFTLFIVNTGESMMLAQREGSALRLEDARENLDNQIALADRFIEQREKSGTAIVDAEGNEITDLDAKREAVNVALVRSRERIPEAEQAAKTWKTWAGRVILFKTVMPKTQETIKLLDRYLISKAELDRLMAESAGIEPPPKTEDDQPAFADPRVSKRLQSVLRERSLAWILGTSFAFEAVVLGICCVIFARRDF